MAQAFQQNAFENTAFEAVAAGGSVSMALAATEGADLASASMNLAIGMALSATEGADLASGTVALVVSMGLSAVEGADLCVASMDVAAAGAVDMALNATEGADTCLVSADLVGSALPEQQKDGGGGSHWKKKRGTTEGAGLQVPYRHDKPVDEFGYEIDEPLVPATPLVQPSAPRRATVAAGPTALDLAIAPPYREPVAVVRALPTLHTKTGPTPDEVMKAKHNHALRLLLLAS